MTSIFENIGFSTYSPALLHKFEHIAEEYYFEFCHQSTDLVLLYATNSSFTMQNCIKYKVVVEIIKIQKDGAQCYVEMDNGVG